MRAAENDGLSWLDQQQANVRADIVAEEAAALAEAADDTLARKVGLHIRGRASFRENNTDESDPARHQYHTELKRNATAGDAEAAERTIGNMEAAGLAPGPRAYHAYVFAYVKASKPDGALAAIRRCWDAGVVPLPETYAAVVAAHLGVRDLDTAEAVLASNRRAGVDCTRSWQLLVAGLFRMGAGAKAMEAYAQGEAEGLLPDAALYQALIQHTCSQGDAASAAALLEQMQERGLPVSGREHYAPIVRAYAAQGQPQEALSLLETMLLQERRPDETQLLCDAVLEAQLEQAGSMAEVLSGVQRMKALMVVNGLQPGAQTYAAQLRAALRLQELQEALQAFRALRRRAGSAPLAMVDDAELAQLLVGASASDLPAELHEVLAAMCEEERHIPPAALQPDTDGHTALGAWVKRRLDSALALGLGAQPDDAVAGEVEVQAAATSTLVIDGVLIDPTTNMVVDASGEPVGVTRMGVRELRAELAARRAPVSGNKKELVKRLQKLRAADLARAASMLERPDDTDGANGGLVARVRRRAWLNGRLIEDVVTDDLDAEEEADVAAAAADEADEGGDWEADALDEDPLIGGTGPLAMNAEEEDESLFDDTLPSSTDDLREAAMSRRHMLSASPTYASPQAGPRQAAAILLAAVAEMGAQPSEADFAAVATWAAGAGAADAAVLLVAALDRQPQPVAGTTGLRAQMAELYEARAVAEGGDELEVALAELLQPMGDPDGDAGASLFEGELAEWMEACDAASLTNAMR